MFEFRFTGLRKTIRRQLRAEVRITIGSWWEPCWPMLGDWSQADYAEHWLVSARRLVGGAPLAMFCTEFGKYPEVWPARLRGGEVVLTNVLPPRDQLVIDGLTIRPRDGRSWRLRKGISQWTVDLKEIAAFASRQPADLL